MKTRRENKRLIEITDFFSDGDWIEKKDQSPNGIRLIQTGNIGNGFFKDRNNQARYISDTTFDKLHCTEVFSGDCLISRLPDPVGRACILPEGIEERMITAVDCTIVRFNHEKILPKYFEHFSQSREYLKTIDVETTGTTRKRISRKKLGQIEIPLPPLTEQHRIVEILDEAFAAIETARANAEKNLANARELFESYLQSVFANPGDDWEEKTIGEVCDLENGDRGKNYPSKSKRTKTGIPFINAGHLTDNGIDMENVYHISRDHYNLLSQGKIQKGDILFCLRGSLGKVSSVGNLAEGAIASSLVIVRSHNNIHETFLLAYFQSHLSKEMIEKFKGGAAQPNLSAKSLSNFTIPLPPLSEQQTLVSKLDALSTQTKKLEAIYTQKITALDELKQSLLQKAFEGELTREFL